MALHLSRGTISKLKTEELLTEPITVQVSNLTVLKENSKYNCNFSDGAEEMFGLLASDAGKMVGGGKIKNGDIVQLTASTYSINFYEDGKKQKLIATGVDKVTAGVSGVKAEPTQNNAGPPHTPAVKPEFTPEAKENMHTPSAIQRNVSPLGGFKTPSQGPTPYSSERKMGSMSVQPICALNPYNNNWKIKAKIIKKESKRSYNNNGSQASVFTIEIVDDQGTAIEATFWREVADKVYDALEEGKVYFFSKGKVKPANKTFSALRNNYSITFDAGFEFELCADEDPSKMQAKLLFIPIDQLEKYIIRKAPVDILAVVTSIGASGSIKRKSDNSELTRRDITLLDQSLRTVTLTLWGSMAEEEGGKLEGLEAPIVSISSCRVTDYNGVSVSSLQRSSLVINPEIPEATTLRNWYDSIGRTSIATHAGEGMAKAIKAGGAAQERGTLALMLQDPPQPEEKQQFHSVSMTVGLVDPDQQLYYTAHPETNRKLVERDGGYYCEHDGQTYTTMVRRYIVNVSVMDYVASSQIMMYNDQAEMMLGVSAEELHTLKETDKLRFEAILQNARMTEWLMRLNIRSREYQGKLSLKGSAANLQPLNFAAECSRLTAAIDKLRSS